MRELHHVRLGIRRASCIGDGVPTGLSNMQQGCGTNAGLTTSLAFDRGFGLVTNSISPGYLQTSASYDDYGRLKTFAKPDGKAPYSMRTRHRSHVLRYESRACGVDDDV